MQILSYFNPFSNEHHALEDSKKLSDGQHALVWLASILLGSVTLGIGGVALFRALVGRATAEPTKKEEVAKTRQVYDYVKTKPEVLKKIFGKYPINDWQLKIINKVPLETWKEYKRFLNSASDLIEPPITETLLQGFVENLNENERRELVYLLEKALGARPLVPVTKNPPRDSRQDMEKVD